MACVILNFFFKSFFQRKKSPFISERQKKKNFPLILFRLNVNTTVIIDASFGGKYRFVAYTYLGDLATYAFGFNNHGIGFTINYVGPKNLKLTENTFGHGYITRLA